MKRSVPTGLVLAAVAFGLSACSDLSQPTVENPSFGKAKGNAKVTICHKGKTITVTAPSVPAHLRHADTEGPCVTIPTTITYNLIDHESSMDSYASWSSNIRTRYECPGNGAPIAEGRGGYYWKAPLDRCTVGWCSEILCCGTEIVGLEIFNFPVDTDPQNINSATLRVHTFTQTDKSWWAQVGFDVLVNDVKVGTGISAVRGAEKTIEIPIEDVSVLRQGLNNIFIVYNEDRTGYGFQTYVDWVELMYQ